ncbi:MAG: dihydroorotate dehydrogenase electron transfer subunit [Armatimonadetes bacterium]|nr:dihydroorotate dehydrogenase electron transfer subunit [Armatimonadota bacterium]
MPDASGSPPIKDVAAALQTARWLSPIHILLTFRAPTIATHAVPGQFVHLRVTPVGTSPLLRRPFSIAGTNLADGTVRLLVRTIGRGTAMLGELLLGAELPALGPLGRGFPDVRPDREVVLVAGGVGVAPLLFYATAREHARKVALYGAETQLALVLADELAETCDRLLPATDDGTLGHHGFVTDLLPTALDDLRDPVVLACGPRPMMAKTAEVCRRRAVECHVSFEAWLGCGVGACLGCVIPAAGEPDRYVRVCRDGPVFDAEEIGWEALR